MPLFLEAGRFDTSHIVITRDIVLVYRFPKVLTNFHGPHQQRGTTQRLLGDIRFEDDGREA
ncbi:hypothetical protein CCS01_02605 [Rhodopila globiformis]|uniref:Uncharacterized protein n=1 Tax=Rhodopila globiformis TaxID=1071 RepID=A0A2S6NN89_RHOGL|nr:hypothetical protein CCS01_02605 [Rhodopila globiformis]